MSQSRHLHIAVSGHGFGHAAQLSPIVTALRDAVPGLRTSLAGALPPAAALEFFGPLETHDDPPLDVGMVMAGPMRVLAEESLRAYLAFHENWETKVVAEAARLVALAPDLVLADVPYLPLAGAAQAGIPAVALSSLNWAEIFAHYCGTDTHAMAITNTIRDAYNSAHAFLQVSPTMAMPGLGNLQTLGPVARIGQDRKAAILEQAGHPSTTRLALCSLGGIKTGAPDISLPVIENLAWIAGTGGGDPTRPDVLDQHKLAMPFIDQLASADLVITKPGYGTFTEAACNGTRVLYASRGDWPEEAALGAWLHEVGCACEIPAEVLANGNFGDAIADILSRPCPAPVSPSGIKQATDLLKTLIGEPSTPAPDG